MADGSKVELCPVDTVICGESRKRAEERWRCTLERRGLKVNRRLHVCERS